MNNLFDHYAAGEKLYTRMTIPICEKFELTSMEFTVLMFLANNPQYDTASQIVRFRHLSKSHVSVSASSLERKNLISCQYHNGNRKTLHLTPTEQAQPIIRDGRQMQAQFQQLLFAGFTQNERDTLSDLIDRVDQNIRAQNQIFSETGV